MNQFARTIAHGDVFRKSLPARCERLSECPALRIRIVRERMTRLSDRTPHSRRRPKGIDTGTKINQAIDVPLQLSRCRMHVSSVTVHLQASHNDTTAKKSPSPQAITVMRMARP